MGELYAPDILRLAKDGESPNIAFDRKAFDDVVAWLHRKGHFSADMLADPHARRLIEATYNVLNGAIGASVKQEVPAELTAALRNNAFIFSGFKSYNTLAEIGLELTDDKGAVKPFEKFAEDVRKIDDRYNRAYLFAEYNHAVHSSQMAVKWHDIAQDGEEYNLQYRTAGDDRVREAHARLDGVTLPPSDKFWDRYLPPNGWNCRCQVVQVLREDYTESDSDAATKWGDECTKEPKQQIFRFNAGKELKLFPPKHPYYKVPKEAKTVIEKVSAEEIKAQRVGEIRRLLPDYLTDKEKDAKAANNYEIEQALGVLLQRTMTVEEADRQSANPKHVERYILDPNGMHRDKAGKRWSKNPNYKSTDEQYSINCATCAPAYALRLMGFDVKAKGRVAGSGSLNDSVARNRSFEMWKNADGTAATPNLTYDWMLAKGYKTMTAKRYKEYFEECCADEGVYVLTIGWRGGGGHATILQRFADGELKYIEPQAYDEIGRAHV